MDYPSVRLSSHTAKHTDTETVTTTLQDSDWLMMVHIIGVHALSMIPVHDWYGFAHTSGLIFALPPRL